MLPETQKIELISILLTLFGRAEMQKKSKSGGACRKRPELELFERKDFNAEPLSTALRKVSAIHADIGLCGSGPESIGRPERLWRAVPTGCVSRERWRIHNERKLQTSNNFR